VSISKGTIIFALGKRRDSSEMNELDELEGPGKLKSHERSSAALDESKSSKLMSDQVGGSSSPASGYNIRRKDEISSDCC
jgi:hypothetical protein